MPIQGELSGNELPGLFQMLSSAERRGRLMVSEAGQNRSGIALWVDGEALALDEEQPAQASVGALVATGCLTPEAVARVAARDGGVPGGGAPATGMRIPGEAEAAARDWSTRERMLQIFLWPRLRFELDESSPRQHPGSAAIGITPLLMEAARRADEWSEHVDAGALRHRVMVRSDAAPERGEAAPADLPPVEALVLAAVDGRRTGALICVWTGLERFHVEVALARLEARAWVEALPLGEVVATADELLESGRVAEADALLQAAIHGSPMEVWLHQRLATTRLELGRIADAAAHWRYCAVRLARSDARDEATALVREVVRVLPTDLVALEHAVRWMAEGAALPEEDARELQARALEWVAALRSAGQPERGLALVRQLSLLAPGAVRLHDVRADLERAVGDPQEGLAILVRLAEEEAAKGQREAAAKRFDRLVEIDGRGRRQHQRRAAELRAALAGRRRPQRRGLKAAAVAALCVMLGLAFALHARMAQSAYEELGTPEGLGPAGLSLRVRELGWILERFPFAPVRFAISEEREALRAKIVLVDEAEDRDRERLATDRKERLTSARALVAGAEVRIVAGDIPAGVKILERALASGAGLEWPERSEVEALLRDGRRHLAGAEGAVVEARRLVAAGDREAAHESLRLARGTWPRSARLAAEPWPLTVRLWPHQATLFAAGQELGSGELAIDLAPGTTRKVIARAPAHRDASFRLDASRASTDLILDAEVARTYQVGRQLATFALEDARTLLLVARGGRIGRLDLRGGRTTWWPEPNSFTTHRLPPLAIAGRALIVAESGWVRAVLPGARELDWQLDLKGHARIVHATAWKSRLLLFDAEGQVSVIEPGRGELAGRIALPAPMLRCASDEAGFHVLDRSGQLSRFALGAGDRLSLQKVAAGVRELYRTEEGLSFLDARGLAPLRGERDEAQPEPGSQLSVDGYLALPGWPNDGDFSFGSGLSVALPGGVRSARAIARRGLALELQDGRTLLHPGGLWGRFGALELVAGTPVVATEEALYLCPQPDRIAALALP